MFWPAFGSQAAKAGIYVFRFGSVFYLCASLSGVNQFTQRGGTRQTVAILSLFIVGALLYITGGALSELNQSTEAFASAWLAGSVCFAAGGTIMLVSALGAQH